MRQYFLYGLSRKDDSELLSSHAIGAAAPRYAGEVRRHQAQHLVASLMSIGVVEFLEVVDVHDCDGVRVLKTKQRLIKSSPCWQSCKLVVISKKIGIFDNGTDQNQPGGGHVCGSGGTDTSNLKTNKCCHQSPQHATLSRLAVKQN